MAPPADKDQDKDKDQAAEKRKAGPVPRGRRRKPPTRPNIRDAASEAADQRSAEEQATSHPAHEFEDAPGRATRPETNGHGRPGGDEEWPDYSAQAGSWDPWEEGQADGPGAGLNRTLGQWLEAVVPPEAQLHFLAAAQEFAAGVQTTLEYHLHPEARGDDGGAGALRIDIE